PQESQIGSNNVSTNQLHKQPGAKHQHEVIKTLRQLQEQSNYWNIQRVRVY
ncbi:4303_t:CDS:2, partial [Racocetra persica]